MKTCFRCGKERADSFFYNKHGVEKESCSFCRRTKRPEEVKGVCSVCGATCFYRRESYLSGSSGEVVCVSCKKKLVVEKKKRWDSYFMEIAEKTAVLSKDESTKLGCVIVGPDREIRSTGFNSFPRGINDNMKERQVRPIKYKFFEHAERNAIYNAARVGVPLKGCTLYCRWPPCSDCARAIIQTGIVEVVVSSLDVVDRWKVDWDVAKAMLDEAKVVVREAQE
jgi:dCMP deaminase